MLHHGPHIISRSRPSGIELIDGAGRLTRVGSLSSEYTTTRTPDPVPSLLVKPFPERSLSDLEALRLRRTTIVQENKKRKVEKSTTKKPSSKRASARLEDQMAALRAKLGVTL